MASDKIKVAIRVRPFNRREIELGTKCVVEVDQHQTILHNPNSRNSKQPKSFAFDQCFWSFNENHQHYASQEVVFNSLGADILDNAFQGYNACILAYGQTGSGKSFTMMGSEDNKGLIPRLCDALFERIDASGKQSDYKVEVSYMEIYNEKVHDLLDPKGCKQTLKVREHNILGPYVDGLSTLAVSSYEEINNLMTEGNKSRTVAATNMNSESSRSHAVFTITLTCTVTDEYSGVTGEKVSKMSLVDLAGSERAIKTGAVGERLKEGSNINKSLTTLGLVISKLADQSCGKTKDKFVAYRDSVLTWLLKDNLGGNSRTVMVATISPAADNYDETLSTLRYADRAKRIVNHAVVNEDPNARIIRDLRDEVEMLKEQLKGTAQEDLQERLKESEKLMQEISQTWEEKLRRTEKIHQERQQALEQMGISVQASGIKVEQDKYYLVNLNADPSLNELLVYYLKDKTVVGYPGASSDLDIQLSGLGIMPKHCIILIENSDLFLIPEDGARTCVNGSVVTKRIQLHHGDRILWGNNHFFRVNCPKTSNCNSPEIPERPLDYDFAREELMMNELSNDPIQSAMAALEKQHEEDKQIALDKQRQMYERQLQILRNQMSPGTPYSPYPPFDLLGLGKYTPAGTPTSNVQSRMERWAQDRDELFKKSLAKLREDIVRANGLVREANFLAEEMGKETEFKVTLQIPAANLSPNRKKGAFVSEPAVLVKRRNKNGQVWSMEKLENKLIDMREMYQERKEKGLDMKEGLPPKAMDPFYESQENHNLIGVANVFLDFLFHDVKLDYQVPIISQQGEVAGRLHVEICRVDGSFLDNLDNSECEGDRNSEMKDSAQDVSDINTGRQLTIRLSIKSATGLPPSLSNFVFCQYVFWGHPDPAVVPPIVNPEYPASRKGKDCMTFKFEHEQEFIVNVTEEFVEYCTEGALSIEVWGHRSAGFSSSKPGWDVDVQLMRSRSLADRWSELIRKIELWVEIQELNDLGEYAAVEVIPRPDIATGGVYQLRQGQQRRVVVRVKPVHNSGTLPIICEAITSVSIGGICSRSKLQKPLDSYQEEDLTLLREKWSEALMKRREYLDSQIQKIINKKDKTDQDVEREQSLIDQWVCLTEERNTVLVPAPKSGIPGAPADWDPPVGMEKHIPVIFLDLNADDMSVPIKGDAEIRIAGANSILPKEHGSQSFNLPIVKYCEKEVCATAAWDSSIHDSIHLNRATSPNDRIYLILKASVRLSHPATMDVMLRKRLAINVYKKQSIADKIKKKIVRQDTLLATGVTYEVVSNIPKASEDPENREMLALMAASGEDAHTNDGESYIEKYTRGVSAVESILMLDRLRQEVAVKELLAAQGKPLRKTASVPNIAHVLRMDQRLDTTFPQRMDPNSRADSACELTMQSPNDDFKQRNLSSPLTSTPFGKEKSSINSGDSPVTSYALTRPTFLNLSFNLNMSLRQNSSILNSPLNGLTPQSTKLVKPMSTVLEEQSLQSVPECGLDESTEFCDHSRDETCVLNLNEKLAESEDELNNFPPCRIEESSQNNTETSEIVPEKRRILETPDSIGDIQAKVGTPSMISSGYGSQALSTTPASSEDSISIHSVTEDFRDNDFSSEISAPSEDIHQQYYQQNETYIEDFNNNPSENEKLSTDNLLNPQQLDTNAETHSQGSSDGEIPQDPAAEMKFPSWLTVGESIMISPYNKTGVVAYLGPTHFAPGPWAGVELDTPTGKNDGTVNGTRYFECKPRFGIFVRPDKLVVDRRGRDMRAARNSSASSNGTMKRSREDISVHKSHNRSDNHSTSGQWNSAKARSRSRDTTLRVSSTRGKK
ncbi:kinesin-like protein KIF13A [Trichonephila inaurata madagascariensis]|uniref:Kinesin-like protein KIF13A n=1 Tax=Trichonephila inaurata madagascariensis TaxID=2747483 RepID=A0A8X7CLN6_9ARAC|nr:kinesin-like protein KIF13A [Trichonephila inaurata madagascariensis]